MLERQLRARLPPGTTNCSGQCVATGSDVLHCGGCGNACAAPPGGQASCSGGQCGFSCTGGLIECGNACVDPSKLPNCGGCGNTCAPAPPNGFPICVGSACGFDCNASHTKCGNACVNTQSDNNNCGGCGVPCGGGKVCQSGVCATVCASPAVNCSGQCVNTGTDPQHCGACFNACPFGPNSSAQCTAGTCGLACTSPWQDCNKTPGDGCEANPTADALNCGECGNACDKTDVMSIQCTGGLCTSFCQLGYSNCNLPLSGTKDDGCETPPGSTKCGGCGTNCTLQGYGSDKLVCDANGPPVACGCTKASQCSPSGAITEGCQQGLCTCGGLSCRPGEVCKLVLSGQADSGAGGSGGTSGTGATGGFSGTGGTGGIGATGGTGGTSGNNYACSCNGGGPCPLLLWGTNICCPSVGCRDVDNDAQNCGACGRTCPPGFSCSNAQCRCAGNGCDKGGLNPVCSSISGHCSCNGQQCGEGQRCFPGGGCR